MEASEAAWGQVSVVAVAASAGVETRSTGAVGFGEAGLTGTIVLSCLALFAWSTRSLVLGTWPPPASLFLDLERSRTREASLKVYRLSRTAACSALSHRGIARRGPLSDIITCSKSSLDSLWTAEKYPLILSTIACIWLAMLPFACNRRSHSARVCSTSSPICCWASASSSLIFDHLVLWMTRRNFSHVGGLSLGNGYGAWV